MSSPCGRFFLHAVMRFLIKSGTGADIFFVGDALAVTAVNSKLVPEEPELGVED